MTLPSSINDLEKQKFRESSSGVVVAVVTDGDVSGLLSGIQYDDIQASFPNSTTEIYTYLKDSVIVAQIQITYSNASKATFLRAQRL